MGLRKAYGGAHRFKSAELIDISNVGIDGEVTGARTREPLAISPTSSGTATARSSSLRRSTRCCPRWCCPSAAARPSSATARRVRLSCDELKERSQSGSEHYAFQTRQWLGDTYTEAQLKTLRRRVAAGAHASGIEAQSALGRRPCDAHRSVAPGRRAHPAGELLEHATQREFVFRHAWRVAIW